MSDLIDRQAAIDAITEIDDGINMDIYTNEVRELLREVPSVQPTLYGYNIEHLVLIARVLQKENLPPERVVEVLTDIGRIVAIVKDEFEEALRKAVEQCMI